ncbi:hypothetical protein [Chitinophaga arvensicola]|uniref:Uncharacterized protein n=1 Tax=Chitinophaga arvensicola TaxID=29529 RepID=A0A1I0SDY0_9BACT|nr:hypothetical protein [Chitinophaga arvensicola]SEW57337.1 hypothetical protein SAMN04488122_6747 [Chitinophaga arvensicola]
MERTIVRLSCLAALLFAACNSPMQNKQEQQQHDSANAPVNTPSTTEVKSVQLDTTWGDYRIAAISKGNSTMRDLILAVGSKKDTTQADTTIERDVKGQLRNMMLADLDGNGKPEVYFYMLSEGTGQFGKIYGFDLTGKVARISTYSLDTMQQAAYRGQDTFFIKGKTLVRSFPAYRENDPDALTANVRGMIEYRLKKENDTLRLIPAK